MGIFAFYKRFFLWCSCCKNSISKLLHLILNCVCMRVHYFHLAAHFQSLSLSLPWLIVLHPIKVHLLIYILSAQCARNSSRQKMIATKLRMNYVFFVLCFWIVSNDTQMTRRERTKKMTYSKIKREAGLMDCVCVCVPRMIWNAQNVP